MQRPMTLQAQLQTLERASACAQLPYVK